jgi:hypothetical protein
VQDIPAIEGQSGSNLYKIPHPSNKKGWPLIFDNLLSLLRDMIILKDADCRTWSASSVIFDNCQTR